jgi:hypothetical protein
VVLTQAFLFIPVTKLLLYICAIERNKNTREYYRLRFKIMKPLTRYDMETKHLCSVDGNIQEDVAVNDYNNANSCAKNFPAFRYKYVNYHMQKATLHYITLHYTTQVNDRNGWRQTNKQMGKWKLVTTKENKTDTEATQR